MTRETPSPSRFEARIAGRIKMRKLRCWISREAGSVATKSSAPSCFAWRSAEDVTVIDPSRDQRLFAQSSVDRLCPNRDGGTKSDRVHETVRRALRAWLRHKCDRAAWRAPAQYRWRPESRTPLLRLASDRNLTLNPSLMPIRLLPAYRRRAWRRIPHRCRRP